MNGKNFIARRHTATNCAPVSRYNGANETERKGRYMIQNRVLNRDGDAIAVAVKSTYNEKQRIARFAILGEIDHHGAKKAREEIDRIISAHHPKRVELVLDGVSFMDSAGLGLMLGRYTRVQEYGGELTLVNPTPAICKILALAGADKLFGITFEERREEA